MRLASVLRSGILTGVFISLLLIAAGIAALAQQMGLPGREPQPATFQLDPPSVVRARGLPNPPRTPCERALQSEPFTSFRAREDIFDKRASESDVLNRAIKDKSCLPSEVDAYLINIGARRKGISSRGVVYTLRTGRGSFLEVAFGLWIQLVVKDGFVEGVAIAVNK